jgi:hypothetical protein
MRIRIRIQLFTLIRIRIQLLFKVMGIYENWSINPLGLHFVISSLQASIVSVHGPLLLNSEPLKLLTFDFNANLDPVSKIMRIHVPVC